MSTRVLKTRSKASPRELPGDPAVFSRAAKDSISSRAVPSLSPASFSDLDSSWFMPSRTSKVKARAQIERRVQFDIDQRVALAQDVFANENAEVSEDESNFPGDDSSDDEYAPIPTTRSITAARKAAGAHRQTRALTKKATPQVATNKRPQKPLPTKRTQPRQSLSVPPAPLLKKTRPRNPLPIPTPSSVPRGVPIPSKATMQKQALDAVSAAALAVSAATSALSITAALIQPKKRKRRESTRQVENRKRRKRQKTREKEKEARRVWEMEIRDCSRRHLGRAEPIILKSYDITKALIAQGGWRGRQRHLEAQPDVSLEEAKAMNIQVLALEGEYDVPILDQNQRNIILYRPRDLTNRGVKRQDGQTEQLDILAENGKWQKEKQGHFGVARRGHIHLGGTGGPVNCVEDSKRNSALLDNFFASDCWQEDAKLSDIAWQTFNPKMHRLYHHVRLALQAQFGETGLTWNFDLLPFSTTAINLGPQVVCKPHSDAEDFSTGWGVLKAFKDFDHTKGGHVVFWELGIAIEFPAGAELWFPTALFIHSNLTIAEHETRYSVTSYTGAGLFQWVYRGGVWPCHWKVLLHPEKGKEPELVTPDEWANAAALRRSEQEADRCRPMELIEMCFPIWE